MAGAAISLEHVTKAFAGRTVIREATLDVAAGERLALIGPSGCGKSTLLRMVLGLVTPDAGTVRVGGVVVDATTSRDVRRRVGYVLQDGGLFPHLTARDNVTLVARLDGGRLASPRGSRRGPLASPRGSRRGPLASPRAAEPEALAKRASDLADLARLPSHLLDRYPQELSGGERQRVGLMRALMLEPEVLLLDEPLGALDPIVRARLQEDLRGVFRDLGLCVLVVTHDMAEAAYLAEAIAVIRDGEVLQRGTMKELVEAPAHPFVTELVGAQRSIAEALR